MREALVVIAIAGCGSAPAQPQDASLADSDAASDGAIDAPPPVLCTVDVSVGSMVPETGLAYHVTKNFGFRGDSPTAPTQSPMEVLENGQPIGEAHTQHADIRTLGGGRFSHWGNGLYFSASDGSDPRSNGRTYAVRGPCHAPRAIEVHDVAHSTTGYATFQSHNQRMVANQHGIFVSYLAAELTDGRMVHRLGRSTDGGQSFQTIFQGLNPTKAPAVETDAAGNVYTFYSEDYNYSSEPAIFRKFEAAAGFTNPLTTEIPQGSAGKFAALYDPGRDQFYYFSFWNAPHPNFFTLDKNGTVVSQRSIIGAGPNAGLQYPHLRLDGTRLFAGWTTQDLASPTALYRSIHFMFSDDGGANWKIPSGPVTTPVIGDETGPTPQLVLADELTTSTWLSSFLPTGGAVHAFYYASGPLNRQHYVKIDLATGGRVYDQTPVWSAGQVNIATLDGFFATGANAPIFAVGISGGNRIGVLASDDGGLTWLDYALSEPIPSGRSIYAIGGARELTPDGDLIGSYTELQNGGSDHIVRFFRVKAEAWP